MRQKGRATYSAAANQLGFGSAIAQDACDSPTVLRNPIFPKLDSRISNQLMAAKLRTVLTQNSWQVYAAKLTLLDNLYGAATFLANQFLY